MLQPRESSVSTCSSQPGDPFPAHDLGVDDRCPPGARPARGRRSRRRTRTRSTGRSSCSAECNRAASCSGDSVFRSLSRSSRTSAGRRQDEDGHRLREKPWTLGCAPCTSMSMTTWRPRGENLRNLAPERAVEVPVDLRRLGELALSASRQEFLARQEVVVHAVPLAAAAGSGWCTTPSSRGPPGPGQEAPGDRRLSAA